MNRTNYIYYSFDPVKDIMAGMKTVEDRGLQRWTTLRKIQADNSKQWEDTNFSGRKIGSKDSVEKQFDLEDGLSKFISTRLLKELEDAYDTVLSEVDLGGNILPSRIKFSSKPMGIFDFGQASKGLIRPVEFFSTVDNKIINPKVVNKETKGGENLFYYLKKTEKIYVQRRQEGTTKMVDNCPELDIKQNNKLKLFLPYRENEIVNECKGFRLRYTSTNPKVYAYREKLGGGTTPYVDLYIAMGGVYDQNPESMSIRSVPNLLLARTLENAGVKVRIFGLWSTGDGRDIFTIALLIKNYGESVSTNQLAILCADTRFYRYWLSISAKGMIYDKFGVEKPVFEGTGTLRTENINDYIMPRLRNFTLYNIQDGKFPSQLVNKRLILFVPLDADSDDKIDSEEVRKQIKETYTKFVDYICLEFSINPAKVIKDIRVRQNEEGMSASETKRYLREAIANVYKTTREYKGSDLELTDSEKIEQADNILDKENQYILDTQDGYEDTEKSREKLFEIINKTIK